MRIGLFRRRNHLRLGRLWPPIQDIFAHRAVQQTAVLADHANLTSHRILSDPRNILPVDQNPPGLGIVKPQHQLHQRRFTRPRTPHNANLFPRRHVQRNRLQPTRAAPVMVRDALNLHMPLPELQRRRPRLIDQSNRLGDGLHPLLHGA